MKDLPVSPLKGEFVLGGDDDVEKCHSSLPTTFTKAEGSWPRIVHSPRKSSILFLLPIAEVEV